MYLIYSLSVNTIMRVNLISCINKFRFSELIYAFLVRMSIFVYPQKETPDIAAALGRDNHDYELAHSDCCRAVRMWIHVLPGQSETGLRVGSRWVVHGICGGIGPKYDSAGESRQDHSYRNSLSCVDGYRGYRYGAHRHFSFQRTGKLLAAVLYIHFDCVRNRA